jgi:hypothetical protein
VRTTVQLDVEAPTLAELRENAEAELTQFFGCASGDVGPNTHANWRIESIEASPLLSVVRGKRPFVELWTAEVTASW